jgi:hypothetical protein
MSSPTIGAIVQTTLPSTAIIIFNAALPYLLEIICYYQGFRSKTDIELSLLKKWVPPHFSSPPVRQLITTWHVKIHTLPPCHGALHLLSSVDLLGTRSRPCWLSGEDSSKVGQSTYTEQREGVLHVIRDAAR